MKLNIKNKGLKILLIVIAVAVLIFLIVIFIMLSSKDRGLLFSKNNEYNHGGHTRTYRLVKPSQDIKKIVFGLHGFSDFGLRFAYYSGLHNVTDENTLVVYPEAVISADKQIKKGWNAGFCCGSGFVNNVDDVGFILDLTDKLKSEFNANDASVFITGFSNGAFMAQRIAAEHPDKIDAIGVSSGSIGTEKLKLSPNAPVSVLLLHGEKDEIVPFNGGAGRSDPDINWLSFKETLTTWQTINKEYVNTKSITYPDDGHKWHDWRILNIWHKQPQATKEIVNFFNK